jgi:hypothetical protein
VSADDPVCPRCFGEGEVGFNPSRSYPQDHQLDDTAPCPECHGMGLWTDNTDFLAYQGKKDCTDPRCRGLGGPEGRMPGCLGWHCPRCHAPVSMMGHTCSTNAAVPPTAEQAEKRNALSPPTTGRKDG